MDRQIVAPHSQYYYIISYFSRLTSALLSKLLTKHGCEDTIALAPSRGRLSLLIPFQSNLALALSRLKRSSRKEGFRSGRRNLFLAGAFGKLLKRIQVRRHPL